jgi:hypothetical protein
VPTSGEGEKLVQIRGSGGPEGGPNMLSFSVVSLFVKVKQYHYRPGQALRVPGALSSQISRQQAHVGDKVVSPTHRPSLPRRKYSWHSFLLEDESTPGP